ncbi:MAG: T9SS type A sorting domain-containing protein, partial [Candidatus Eisenbacteria bacterium]
GLAGTPSTAAATSAWTAEGGGPTRSYADPTIYGSAVGGAATAILDGQVRAYPNPARQQPITFAFRLREAGRVTLSVYDAAARLVERIERDGSASDNAITWDPAGRTSGLYVARIEVPGQVVTTPFALIR